MPSPSSPPTMLKPKPVEPLWSTTFLGSLYKQFRLYIISGESLGFSIFGSGGGRQRGRQLSRGTSTKASVMLCSGNRSQRLPELHRGMVLYLGSLVPNSVVTKKEPRHMLTHTCLISLSLTHMHTKGIMHGMASDIN